MFLAYSSRGTQSITAGKDLPRSKEIMAELEAGCSHCSNTQETE